MATKQQREKMANAGQEDEQLLFDLSNPEEFRKAFLAAEILNRKY